MNELQVVASSPVAAASGSGKSADSGLAGHLSALDVALATLAYAGPLAGTAGYVTLVIGFGNGLGAPLTFFSLTMILLCFAAGYNAMTRFVPNPGAFYAYITAGLGRSVGLALSFLLLGAYIFIGTGFYGFAGIAAKQFVEGMGGPVLDWWLYAFVFWISVATLAYFHVAVSARILGILLVAEVLIVLVFDAAVLVQGGHAGINFQSFTWPAFTSGHLGLAMIFAVSMFSGFEATAIYREETIEPEKTIPRATVMVVLFIGLFYMLTSWTLILGIGTADAVQRAAAQPAEAFVSVSKVFLGKPFYDLTSILLLTSTFAAHLAIQNVTTRYIYSLAVDGVLPESLGVAHARHRSPHRASMAASVFYLGLTAVLILLGLTSEQVYSWFAGLAAFMILCAMTVTSVAAVVFFRVNTVAITPWKTLIAPAIATIGLFGMVWLGVINFPVLIGGSSHLANAMLIFSAVLFVAGLIYARWLKAHRPDVYERIGRN